MKYWLSAMLVTLATTLSLMASENTVRLGAGGLVITERDLRGDTTNFIMRNSIFLKGKNQEINAGYSFHFLYYIETATGKETMGVSTGYIWLRPMKDLEISAGKIKRPTEKTYLFPYYTWLFPRQPAIFKLLKTYGMAPAKPGIQISYKLQGILKVQADAFQTDSASENLLYFGGAEFQQKMGGFNVSIFYHHGLQPLYSKMFLQVDNTEVKLKNESNLAGLLLKGYNAYLLYQFVDLRAKKQSTPADTDYINAHLVQASYEIPIGRISVRPKVRFETIYDDGKRKNYTTGGMDLILYRGGKYHPVVKAGMEYESSKEEKTDLVRLYLTVVYF